MVVLLCILACALCQAVFAAQFELAANQGALVIDAAQHGVPVECCAPAIIQASHGTAAPLVGVDIDRRHAGVGDQQYFKAATTSLASAAGHSGFWHRGKGNFHGLYVVADCAGFAL